MMAWHRVRRWVGGWAAVLALLLAAAAACQAAGGLHLKVRSSAGYANGEPLVMADCAGSSLKIKPCSRVARSWLNHLNSRAHAFGDAYRAAGFSDPVTSATLGCEAGIYSPRKTRQGNRNSRHAYGEACDGSAVWVNGRQFDYRAAVRNAGSIDRKFFVSFLDAWGEIGPGCVPQKGYTVFGVEVGCRPIMSDNCGVIDWRERGPKSQYASTYHLSFCLYTNVERAYE